MFSFSKNYSNNIQINKNYDNILLSLLLLLKVEDNASLETKIFNIILYPSWEIWYFLILPCVIICCSILVILLKNPIYSLLNLIIVIFHIIFLLLSFKIEFLSMLFLIVYIGAIAILFLFVIMMFNLKQLSYTKLPTHFWKRVYIYMIILPKFFFSISYAINSYIEYNDYFIVETKYRALDINYFLSCQYTDILLFSNMFYTHYSYFFILSGIILLIAMLGSIVLALSTTEH